MPKMFASRRLHFQMDDRLVDIEVRIGPILDNDGPSACGYTLPVIDGDRQRFIYGEDTMQALQLCLRHVSSLIDGWIEDGHGDVWWIEPGDHGGFR